MSHVSKAKLLRQKLREQKVQKDKEEGKEPEKNEPEEKKEEKPEEKEKKPVSRPPLKPSALKQTVNIETTPPVKIEEKEKEKEIEKKIDPLDFFNQEHKEEEPPEVNEELNELLDMIEGDDKKKENEKEKKKDDSSDSDSNSSSSSDEGNQEEQRLLNMKNAQAKLFANRNNRVSPVNNLFKQKKISEELTKEQIIEKFGADFDKAVELPELNEQKKQIMLKKMRKTINKMSSQRIQNHMDAELRHIIEDKIEDLKKIKGANYCKIEGKVQELILSLKQPDFYFADDEDVTQISDVQEKMDIKPRTDIDFEFFMKQTPKTN